MQPAALLQCLMNFNGAVVRGHFSMLVNMTMLLNLAVHSTVQWVAKIVRFIPVLFYLF